MTISPLDVIFNEMYMTYRFSVFCLGFGSIGNIYFPYMGCTCASGVFIFFMSSKYKEYNMLWQYKCVLFSNLYAHERLPFPSHWNLHFPPIGSVCVLQE